MAKPDYHKAAGVYARTLLELGSEKGNLGMLREDMEILRGVFVQLPELDRALSFPALSAEKKSVLVKSLADNACDLVKRLIRLLEIKGRLALLKSIAGEFLRLEEQRRNVRRARVVSALPLSAGQLEQLSQGLSKRRPGQTYLLQNEVDPTLIAGFRIEEEDFVTDTSLRHKLNTLRHKLAT